MGKSPGKWIKSIFRPKKSKQNHIPNSANNGDTLVSSKPSVIQISVQHPVKSQPPLNVAAENGVAAKLQDGEFAISCAQGDENAQAVANLGSHEDPERITHEIAATEAQAAIRGYLARCQFQSLKGIIRLQAVIRGHLVRRQAVATVCCVWAIVKLQALARGQKVRRSAVGIEVQNTCNMVEIQGAKCSSTSRTCTSTLEEKLIKNVFIHKLLASSKGASPLSLQYTAGETNSSWEWADRWTSSHFWKSCSRQKKNGKHEKVQKVDTKQGRSKQSVQKPSCANTEHGSGNLVKDSTKTKRNSRKLLSHTAVSLQEHSQKEFQKGNHIIRKASDSTKVAHERFDVDNGKTKRNVGKFSTVATEDSEDANVALAVTQVPEVEGIPKAPAVDDQVDALHKSKDMEFEIVGNNGKIDDIAGAQSIQKDYRTASENQKVGDRRCSFPSNVEHQENGVHSASKVPSYMAPTESARAKLRGQGSPRFSEDATESSGTTTTRRHSLPSFVDAKFTSMSPRAQKPVHAASKGVVKSDRSLSASRDGSVSDKGIKAEWRR
ncbi:protein IQ-DOMAIN 29 [Mercurialis annua]|uniref:protein IQ-DOMAIN 29 n=1 Tax=Mercurialis annua TaxID=3986 RepID=UPI00215EC6F2|nr:protein IQ-DOMAIN 29 [Mercurialis annua]